MVERVEIEELQEERLTDDGLPRLLPFTGKA
jgi:hypothetical protein